MRIRLRSETVVDLILLAALALWIGLGLLWGDPGGRPSGRVWMVPPAPAVAR